MVTFIEISPEIVRMAQVRTRATGQPLANEISRMVAEEEIMSLDPSLDLLIEGAQSLSEIDALVTSLGVNSIRVNGREIDVRPVDSDGRVSVQRALVGTPYLAAGTLIVKLEGNRGGRVVGHIGPGTWLAAEEHGQEDVVFAQANIGEEFDLAATVTNLIRAPQINFAQSVRSLPDANELLKFLTNRHQMIVARQKQIITAICAHAEVRKKLMQVAESMPLPQVTRVLNHSALWALRVEKMVERLSATFPELKRQEIAAAVIKAGETYGGQTEAPEFRRHVLKSLAEARLARKFSGQALSKVRQVMDQVLKGQTAQEAVGSFVKNKVAVAIAQAIREQRRNVESFTQVTADEIGSAFKQLALQPAYATHSFNPESGIESINEALELLEAGALAEQIEAMDMELASN